MIARFFSRKTAAIAAPSQPSTPDGLVVWAIGDVHGRADLLKPLLQRIEDGAQADSSAGHVAVLLGDYIDRGPDSAAVLSCLAALKSDAVDWRFLKGNHEQAMLDFLVRPEAGARWCEYGGDATLASYGLAPPVMRHRAEAWARLSADLNHRVGVGERAFLEKLELSVTLGDYFFSHAGARPGVSLDRQSAEDLLWIRRSFLDDDAAFDRIVVHGHTPTAHVHADHRRIGVDTRAYDSGVLTALRLEGREAALLQAREEGSRVTLHTRSLDRTTPNERPVSP